MLPEKMEAAFLKVVAFFLPQFYVTPENDRWWGKGFTEWTLVQKAHPLFPGHIQPRQPATDLGFYDLREPGVLAYQIELARTFGITGFCFYHYWFNGKLLLDEPLKIWLSNRALNFPFCLAWANEPWTRSWDGLEQDVLQPQQYGGRESWVKHFKYLLPFLTDRRAIRIDGRPILLIYRAGHIPFLAQMIDTWREEANAAKTPYPFIVAMLTKFKERLKESLEIVDGICEYAPFAAYDPNGAPSSLTYSYDIAWEQALGLEKLHRSHFKGAFVSWDNTPRRGRRGRVFWEATPEKYKLYLERQLLRVLQEREQNRILFINAWNEWSEGCHLEPDIVHGARFLKSTRAAIESALLYYNQAKSNR
jgi:lipopolysaccharide biosynthesis protein